MATVDLTIMGAGVFGLSIAFICAERGARVRVIDPRHPGAGSSGGIVGALAPHVPENWNDKKAFQLDSLLMAEAFWNRVQAASNLPTGYGRTGRLQPITDQGALDLARARQAGAAALWRGRAEWQIVRGDDWPFAPPSPTGYLIHDTLSARIHPGQACAALAGAVRTLGGEIVHSAAATGPVIWATGHEGLRDLSAALNRSMGDGVKGQAVLLDFDARDQPQLFADTLHFVPHSDGTLAIGSTSERHFDQPDSTDAQLDALYARALAALPALAGAPVLRRWAGVRPRARSRAPMLGHWPDRPGHYIANGGFKIGFGMAPMVAQVMADLVLDNRDTIPPGFHPAASQ